MKPLIMSMLLVTTSMISFAADIFNLKGYVKDKWSDTDLPDVTVRLLNATDSSKCSETVAHAEYYTNDMNIVVRPAFFLSKIDRSKKYVLEMSREGYENFTMSIDPSTLSSRLLEMDLGVLYMTRKSKTLDEVVVKTSKVKFYNNGDTIVYNADAFLLTDGSMLDALISQLPGVRLDSNGQITVNGRFVENLLLDGKEFFKGDNKLMLDNLGAYMVKTVNVYEKQNDMDAIMGVDYGKKELTMDVRLKKDYAQGFAGNVEGGYGTNDRFLGRLFAMWYANNARVTVFGNVNNLNDWNKPGQENGFSPFDLGTGEVKQYQGGIDYWAKIPYSGVSFSGNVMASRAVEEVDRSTYTTNFMPDGETFAYDFTNRDKRSFDISTSHSLEVQKKDFNMKINPRFRYTGNDEMSSLSSAVFSKEMPEIGKEFIDNLFNGASAPALASILNRNLDDCSNVGHTMNASLFSNGKVKMTNKTDAMTWLISGNYNRRHFNRSQNYLLNIGSDASVAESSIRHFDNTPDYSWTAKGAFGYIRAIKPGMFLDSWYQYDRTDSREVSDLYRLDRNGGDAGASLPSVTERDLSLDMTNSFDSRKTTGNHSVNFSLNWRIPSVNLTILAQLPLIYRHQHLDYRRGDVNASINRDKFLIGDATLNMYLNLKNSRLYFNYERRISSPDLVDMVDFRDALDPLKVKLGNSSLKDSERHSLILSYRTDSDSRLQHSERFYGNMLRNALAYGYSYDLSTGVKTGRMYNVNGNYDIGVSQSTDFDFGASRQFSLGNYIDLNYARSKDLLSENGTEPRPNRVDACSLRESLDLSFVTGKNKFRLSASGKWNRFDPKESNVDAFTARDYTCGVTGLLSLTDRLRVMTDFTVYIRRGYSDPSLNKTNFVWNGRISYELMKGQLALMADGFDILHNLSNVFYNVNAQARTETYTNVLPSYVLFHVQWKFNKKPKKR